MSDAAHEPDVITTDRSNPLPEAAAIGYCDTRGLSHEEVVRLYLDMKAEAARLRGIIERLEEAHSDERDELWCRPIHAEALAAVRKHNAEVSHRDREPARYR